MHGINKIDSFSRKFPRTILRRSYNWRMRNFLILAVILLQACSMVSPFGMGVDLRPNETATTTLPAVPQQTATATVAPTEMPPTPTPVPSATATATVAPTEGLPDYQVRTHPDGGLFVGDRVSFEVIAPPGETWEGRQAQIHLESPEDLTFGPVDFHPFGIGGRVQATFMWVWDTAGFDPGSYELTVTILPEGKSWTETVSLAPESELPADEAGARWESIRTECCVLYYISGSDAERDIEDLADAADEEARLASERLSVDFSEPVTVNLIPRVIGHGGFAAEEIYVTYLDENYMGNSIDFILHHEMVHILDGRLEGENRPSIFAEGLAVYLTGGHFKPEPLLPRAAALLELATDGDDWYIPLRDLAANFYSQQHETGYLEGAALIAYMVDRWGWEQFDAFYRDIPDFEDSDITAEIESALEDHYGITFDELEEGFLEELRDQEITPEIRDDLEYTVMYYDTARRYQMLLDPSAYFATAWLMDGPSMRERGIIADVVRSPSAPVNVELIDQLITAYQNLVEGDYSEVDLLLEQINARLDELAGK